MRCSGILGVALLVLGACSDDPAKAFVSPDTSWVLGCGASRGCKLYQTHVQSDTNEFTVSCRRTGIGYEIEITDEPFEGLLLDFSMPPRPGGMLRLRNADPSTGRCNVEVRDKQEYQSVGSESFTGECGIACTLAPLTTPDAQDWDFAAELSCTSLKLANQAAQDYTLSSAGAAQGTPVRIRIDRCR